MSTTGASNFCLAVGCYIHGCLLAGLAKGREFVKAKLKSALEM